MAAPMPTTLLEVLGYEPTMPPLEWRVLEISERDDHVRTLLDYSTVGDERVQAYLLLPRGVPHPMPGVLAIHQDGSRRPYAVGKSEPAGAGGDPELAYGLELCRRGYAVICPDRFGFESRSLASSAFAELFSRFRIAGLLNEIGTSIELTEDLYRGCAANKLLFEGWTMLGKELVEFRRAVDCLVAQPGVDALRLGVIGHSAGGLLAAYAMYLDHRIRVGCASCGTWRFGDAFCSDYLRPLQGFGTLAVVPGMAMWGDTDDVLAGLAPRPWFEAKGDWSQDEVPPEVTQLMAKAVARYGELGIPERFVWIANGSGHAFAREMRQQAYAWFDQWLGHYPESVGEVVPSAG